MKVLLLDLKYNLDWLGELKSLFPEAVVEEGMFPYSDVYEPDNRIFEYLESEEVHKFDLILIGNNIRGGFPKAIMIPEALRSRCVVMWNVVPTEDERRPYPHILPA